VRNRDSSVLLQKTTCGALEHVRPDAGNIRTIYNNNKKI